MHIRLCACTVKVQMLTDGSRTCCQLLPWHKTICRDLPHYAIAIGQARNHLYAQTLVLRISALTLCKFHVYDSHVTHQPRDRVDDPAHAAPGYHHTSLQILGSCVGMQKGGITHRRTMLSSHRATIQARATHKSQLHFCAPVHVVVLPPVCSSSMPLIAACTACIIICSAEQAPWHTRPSTGTCHNL